MSKNTQAELVPIVDKDGNVRSEYHQLEDANLIASGYEFDCPDCRTYNTLISIPLYGTAIKCRQCGRLLKAEDTTHAIG